MTETPEQIRRSLDAREKPTPLTVLTGFLGSGKTTLLSKLLTRPEMANTAVIINEFGEVGLDHLLVTKPKEDMYLISSGCLCCTVRGDLLNTLTSMLIERERGEIPDFDRVIIETTGLADPVPVLLSVTADDALSTHFRIDGVITTVDAVNGPGQLDDHDESMKQVSVADRILITKTDIAEHAALPGLRERLRGLNPGAEQHVVTHGGIEPETLLDIHPDGAQSGSVAAERFERWLSLAPSHGDHEDHDHAHDGDEADRHHHHSSGVNAFSLAFDRPVTAAGLKMWMDMLGAFKGPDLLRVKGILNIDGTPVVIQAVQHLFHPAVTLEGWPTEDRRSRLVFISRNIERADIEQTLDALSVRAGMASAGKPLDPAAYQQFVNAMAGFRR